MTGIDYNSPRKGLALKKVNSETSDDKTIWKN